MEVVLYYETVVSTMKDTACQKVCHGNLVAGWQGIHRELKAKLKICRGFELSPDEPIVPGSWHGVTSLK